MGSRCLIAGLIKKSGGGEGRGGGTPVAVRRGGTGGTWFWVWGWEVVGVDGVVEGGMGRRWFEIDEQTKDKKNEKSINKKIDQK